MKWPISLWRNLTWLLLGLGVYPSFVAQLVAQPDAKLLGPVTSTASPVSTNVPSVDSPARSPVDFFRELLAMDADEREERLAGRDPADRQAILAKLQEYESLTPEERILRLSTTQLHWYMLRFMKAPATNWATILASVPKADRVLVEERMDQWIILPEQLRAEILEYESTSSYFGLRGDAITNTQKVLHELPPDKRRDAEEKLARWNASSPDERRRMRDQFNHFFELTPAEKEKTLSTLSGPEREQMKKTLQSFQQLPKATRELCLQSFGRFSRMTAHEQQQFLKSAERWGKMSPGERDAWQRLVRYLAQSAPMPQGMDPLPRSLRLDPNLGAPASPDIVPLATNRPR